MNPFLSNQTASGLSLLCSTTSEIDFNDEKLELSTEPNWVIRSFCWMPASAAGEPKNNPVNILINVHSSEAMISLHYNGNWNGQ